MSVISKLQFVIEFVNSRVGEFRPKELREYARDKGMYSSTTEQYFQRLHKANFIERIKTGVYIRTHEIPIDLTSTELHKLAYDKLYIRNLKLKTLLENGKEEEKGEERSKE